MCSGQALVPTPMNKHCNQINHFPEIFFLIEEKKKEWTGKAVNRQELYHWKPSSLQACYYVWFFIFFSFPNLLCMVFIHANPEGSLPVGIFECYLRSYEVKSYSDNNNLALSHISDITLIWLKKIIISSNIDPTGLITQRHSFIICMLLVAILVRRRLL